jgi:Phasin protein
MDTTVNQEFGKQALDQAEKLFKDARVPENVQAIAQQGVATSKEYYSKAAAAAQDGAKAMSEIADTAWGSTKMLNEKIVQNLTANAEAAFSAAQAIATAKSLPEIAKLQRPRSSSICRPGPRSTCSRRRNPQRPSRSSPSCERLSQRAGIGTVTECRRGLLCISRDAAPTPP